MLPHYVRLDIKVVTDDFPRLAPGCFSAGISAQSEGDERANVGYVSLRFPAARMFRCAPLKNDSFGAVNRTTRQ